MCGSIKSMFLASLVLLPLLTQEVRAEEKGDDLYALDLEALMNVEIVSASKRAEKSSDAPAVTSVLTANDIKNLGARSLNEAVGFMTGIATYDVSFTNYNLVAVRNNFAADTRSSKLLLLVNGHPIYNAGTGGFDLNWIPLAAVERVELVRGPASVLYGTNALNAVINVITKKDLKGSFAELTYARGSFETNEGRLSSAHSKGNWRYFISTTLKDSDGETKSIRKDQDERGAGFSTTMFDDVKNLFANVGYSNFEFDMMWWNREHPAKYGIGPVSSSFPVNKFTEEGYFFDARHSWNWSEKAKVHTTLRYETHDDEQSIDNLNLNDPLVPSKNAQATSEQSKYGAEVYADISASDNFNVILGALYDVYEAKPRCVPRNDGSCSSAVASFGSKGDSIDLDDTALYTNFTYDISEPFRLVGGARFSDNSETGSHTDYRVGGLYDINSNLVFKALYGTSYRSPNAFELYTDTRTSKGSADLDVEAMDGIDIGFFYTKGNEFLASLIYFFNDTEDFISRTVINNVTVQTNLEGQEVQGIEWEFKWRPSKRYEMFLGGSHLTDSEDKATGNELAFVIDHMVNAVFAYHVSDSFTLSNAWQYRSDWNKADEYYLANFAAYYRLPWWNNKTELFATVNNAFDEDYDYAELVRQRVGTIPGGQGRSYTGGITVRF